MYMLAILTGLLAAVGGCHAGAGPVIAYSERGGLRLGAEVSGGYLFAHGSLGGTKAVTKDGPTRSYVTFDPGFMSAVGHRYPYESLADRMFVSVGGTIGIASSDGEGSLAVGAWTGTSYGPNCEEPGPSTAISVAVGIRWLAGVQEVFATPKFTVVQNCHLAWH